MANAFWSCLPVPSLWETLTLSGWIPLHPNQAPWSPQVLSHHSHSLHKYAKKMHFHQQIVALQMVSGAVDPISCKQPRWSSGVQKTQRNVASAHVVPDFMDHLWLWAECTNGKDSMGQHRACWTHGAHQSGFRMWDIWLSVGIAKVFFWCLFLLPQPLFVLFQIVRVVPNHSLTRGSSSSCVDSHCTPWATYQTQPIPPQGPKSKPLLS